MCIPDVFALPVVLRTAGLWRVGLTVFPLAHFCRECKRVPTGIRTLTKAILSRLPLPLGYRDAQRLTCLSEWAPGFTYLPPNWNPWGGSSVSFGPLGPFSNALLLMLWYSGVSPQQMHLASRCLRTLTFSPNHAGTH
jgi:hypothetical protein